jgi:hypothetical protein
VLGDAQGAHNTTTEAVGHGVRSVQQQAVGAHKLMRVQFLRAPTGGIEHCVSAALHQGRRAQQAWQVRACAGGGAVWQAALRGL